VDSIDYKGRQLHFGPEYLANLAKAFAERAYDYVPFQLAGDENKHTNDVERYGGKVAGMTVDMNGPDGPGLYIDLDATDRGNAVLSENPNLGVSARIVEGYDRSDGRHFTEAIQHVLGTHDPRIPSLGGWRTVEASNDVSMTFDLSGAKFAGDTEGEGSMPELTQEQQARLATMLDIPEDQWNQVVAGLTAPALTEDELAQLTGEMAAEDELTEDELNELLAAAAELDSSGQLEPEPAGAGAQGTAANLSQNALLALELTNARADSTEAQLRDVQDHLDKERWLAERERLIRDGGIPSRIVDMAQPLLLGSAHVVELSNGGAVDAGQIMRQVLGEVGMLHKALGLETGIELGSPLDEPDQHNQAAQAREGTVKAFRHLTGI
jgi:hypothetical protein